MKKFLLAVALIVGVVASQFVAMSQAEAYEPQNGDVAVVYFWSCVECSDIYKQVVIQPYKYSDPDPREAYLYGCHSSKKIPHKWERTYTREIYQFINGQWRRM